MSEAFLAEFLTVIMQCSHHHGNWVCLFVIEAHEGAC